jgi:glutathione S-transferase
MMENTDRPRLIGSSTSPFVRKVRIALLEKKVEHEFILNSSWSPTSPVLTLNPLQKVPLLQIPGQEDLFDSSVIIQALDIMYPIPECFPTQPTERVAALLIEALADGVGDATALLTQETWRSEPCRSTFWSERQDTKIRLGLVDLDRRLSRPEHQNFALTHIISISAATAYSFAKFWQPELVDTLKLKALPALEQKLQEQASWKETAPFLASNVSFPKL